MNMHDSDDRPTAPSAEPSRDHIERLHVRTKRKLCIWCAVALACLPLAALSFGRVEQAVLRTTGDEGAAFMADGFIFGILLAGFACGVVRAVTLARALASDTALKRLHVREHDERTRFCRQEGGRVFSEAMPYICMGACLISAFIDAGAFFGIAILTVVLCVTSIGIDSYYAHRVSARDER